MSVNILIQNFFCALKTLESIVNIEKIKKNHFFYIILIQSNKTSMLNKILLLTLFLNAVLVLFHSLICNFIRFTHEKQHCKHIHLYLYLYNLTRTLKMYVRSCNSIRIFILRNGQNNVSINGITNEFYAYMVLCVRNVQKSRTHSNDKKKINKNMVNLRTI